MFMMLMRLRKGRNDVHILHTYIHSYALIFYNILCIIIEFLSESIYWKN